MVSYSGHATIHSADDAKLYGSLDNMAGFVFGSYLGKLKKKLTRKSGASLQQVIKLLSERSVTLSPRPLKV
jgi:hypothetical protein